MSDGEDSSNKLQRLVVDEDARNEELLADILEGYVGIGKDSGRIIPTPDYENLIAREKLAIILLGQQAKVILGLTDSEWLSPSQIKDISGLAKGTVDPGVRELANKGIADNDEGKYRIPGHKFSRAQKMLTEGDENGS